MDRGLTLTAALPIGELTMPKNRLKVYKFSFSPLSTLLPYQRKTI